LLGLNRSSISLENKQMKTSCFNRLAALLAGTALVAGAAASAFAQDAQTGSTQGSAAVQPASPPAVGASQTKAQRKAAAKEARKEARAKRNAELQQLEGAGYQPGRDNPNYPEDLQNAEKKVGAGQGASQ
jgi:hypothetical protein